MQKLSLFLIGLSFLICSCQNQSVKITQDAKISTSVQASIEALNQQLISGFAAQDPNEVLPLCSPEMAAKGANSFLAVMQQVGKRFDVHKFHILNQFHLQGIKEGITAKVSTTGNHGYTFSFLAANTELFVTVGYFDGPVQDPALIVVYGKYGNSWKLNILQVGFIHIKGKDAYDWYQQAQTDLNQGYLADAANDMALCNLVNQPANQLWHYDSEQNFVDFDKKLTAALNKQYTFPLTFKDVPTHPQVFRIFPQVTNEGYFPMVVYKTSINIKDTTALSKECDQMNQQLGSVLKGLDLGKKYLFYRACSKIPANNMERVPEHGFVRKGKE